MTALASQVVHALAAARAAEARLKDVTRTLMDIDMADMRAMAELHRRQQELVYDMRLHTAALLPENEEINDL